jgi:hypothetical protein
MRQQAVRAGVDRVRRYLPVLSWLPGYRRACLPRDAIAGLTVWALAVPEALAYAGIAGVPVQFGLYAIPLALVGYVAFASSRHLFVGPSATVATLSGGAVASVAAAGASQGDIVALSAALSLLVAAVYLVLGIARMGFVARFFAKPVLDGFIVGLGAYIVVGQLNKLVGIEKPDGNTVRVLLVTLGDIGTWQWLTVATGAAALAALVRDEGRRDPPPRGDFTPSGRGIGRDGARGSRPDSKGVAARRLARAASARVPDQVVEVARAPAVERAVVLRLHGVVDLRAPVQGVGLRLADVARGHGGGRRELEQGPEEARVEMALRARESEIVQLAGRQPVELFERGHRRHSSELRPQAHHRASTTNDTPTTIHSQPNTPCDETLHMKAYISVVHGRRRNPSAGMIQLPKALPSWCPKIQNPRIHRRGQNASPRSTTHATTRPVVPTSESPPVWCCGRGVKD